MPTVSELKSKIDSELITNSEFRLSEESGGYLDAPAIKDTLQTHFDGLLQIAGATDSQIDGDTVTYQGVMLASGFYQGSGSVDATLTFSYDDQDIPRVHIALAPTGTYRLPDTFPLLSTAYPASPLTSITTVDAVLTLDSTDSSALRWEGTLQDEGPFLAVHWMFIPTDLGISSTRLSGTLRYHITADGKKLPLMGDEGPEATFAEVAAHDWGYLSGFAIAITARLRSTINGDGELEGEAALTGHFRIGSFPDVPVVMPLYGEDQGLLSFYVDTGNIPALSGTDLNITGGFFQGDTPATQVEASGFSIGALSLERLSVAVDPLSRKFGNIQLGIALHTDWSLLDDKFILKSIRSLFTIPDPTNASSYSLQLLATLEIAATVDIEVLVGLANKGKDRFFGISLAKHSTIAISDFLEHFADNAALPGTYDLEITELELSGVDTTAHKAYQLHAKASGNLEIIRHFALSRISFDVAYESESGLSPDFSGQFVITVSLDDELGTPQDVSIPLYINVSRIAEGGTHHWYFEGGTLGNGGIPIGRMVAAITNKFGSPVEAIPEVIKDFTITTLKISYHTGNKEFKFIGVGELSLDGSDDKVTASIDFSRTGLSGSFRLGGKVIFGSREVDIVFAREVGGEIDTGATTFALLYYGEDDTIDVIGDLVGSFSPGLFGSHPPSLSINFKQAGFGYVSLDAAPGEERKTGKYLLGLVLSAEFSLSEIPLVGDKIPANLSAEVQDLQVILASEVIHATELSTLNAAIEGAGGTAIANPNPTKTDEVLSKGLNFAISLKLGAEIKPFNLPLGGGDADSSSDTVDTSFTPGDEEGIKWVKIGKTLGPFYFDKIGLRYEKQEDEGQEPVITVLLSASLTLSGLTISLNGLSFSSPMPKVVSNDLFGYTLRGFDPTFDLEGLGIEFEKGAVKIGGAFLRKALISPEGIAFTEYDGTALVQVPEFSLAAIGSYAKYNGEPSLFIYAALDAPLGGIPDIIMLTGVALGFGYNRRLVMPAIDQVATFPLVAEAVAGVVEFDLEQELEKIHTYIPVSTGDIFFAVGIKFTTFNLVDCFALLAASFGHRFELDILGLGTLIVPTPDGGNKSPLAEVQMAFKISYVPEDGVLGVEAQLTPASFVLSKDCHLLGGFAFYSWFQNTGTAKAGDFVYTFGGYHPTFTKPDHYPTVPRVTFSWQVDSHLSLTGSGYFALTPVAVMAGISLDASWHKGHIRAWFKAGADLLIAWKPYHYDVTMHVSLGAHAPVIGSVEVGADLHLWGPDFAGKARIHVWPVTVTVTFGASSSKPADLTWAEFQSAFLPMADDIPDTARYLSVTPKEGLIRKVTVASEEWWVVNPKTFTVVTNSVIPSNKSKKGNTWIVGGESDKEATFGVASMNKTAGAVTSTHHITVMHEGSAAAADFRFTPLRKSIPAALWGQKRDPELNDERLIDEVLTGYEITHAVHDLNAEHTINVDSDRLRATPENIPDAYGWDATVTLPDFVRANISGLNDPGKTALRAGLAQAFGIGAPLDVSVADDEFIFD